MNAEWLTFKFETLNDTPWNATVLSVAFVGGQWSDLGVEADVEKLLKNGEEYFFVVKNQKESYGRVSSTDTIEWWKKQPVEAQNKVFKPESKIDLSQLPTVFNDYCRAIGVNDKTMIMLNGTIFHATLMQSLYKTFDEKMPYEFWNVRDVRTILDIISGSTKLYGIDQYAKEKYDLNRYDALHECIKTVLQASLVLCEEGKTVKKDYEKYGISLYTKW